MVLVKLVDYMLIKPVKKDMKVINLNVELLVLKDLNPKV